MDRDFELGKHIEYQLREEIHMGLSCVREVRGKGKRGGEGEGEERLEGEMKQERERGCMW